VLLSRRGHFVRLSGWSAVQCTLAVYNLALASCHTFAVGAQQVLVHNREDEESLAIHSRLGERRHEDHPRPSRRRPSRTPSEERRQRPEEQRETRTASQQIGTARTHTGGDSAHNSAVTRTPGTELPTQDAEPSTLIPGPYARESVPARGPGRDFTAAERQQINDIGRKYGCHTCGTKDPGTKSGDFIPDNQPPSALNVPGIPQRLYPHCKRCSLRQGGEICKFQQQRNQ
jgi:hypothetical protein